ncbi:MAG TPA: hypothetical protein VGH74_10660 [Planctomycetaceae bacterium]|jgi:hypothetical protein
MTKELSPLQENIKRARRVSVPLIAVTTPDPWHAVQQIFAVIPNEVENPAYVAPVATDTAAVEPIPGAPAELDEDEVDDATAEEAPAVEQKTLPVVKVEWDFVRGFIPRGKAAKAWLKSLGASTGGGEFAAAAMPIEALQQVAAQLPPRGILAMHQADKWLRADSPCVAAGFIQAIWNLRDEFKEDVRTLVLLSKGEFLPAELADDVITFDDPLPGNEQLAAIIREQCEAAALPALADEELTRAVEAVRGLSAFGAEQVTALSLSREGLDIERLWERKRQLIEQTPGLKVYRGDKADAFSQIGGCEVIKSFLSRIMAGVARPNAVVFVDEIEKSLGGASGDLSGVTQDQLGSLLSYMQDHSAAGCIFIGPAGAAKSAIAKAAGAEGGIPTIQLDLGAAKGSLVGQSEQQLRSALKVITAVSNGQSLWIATCNSLADLPPELRRRFTLGTYFFDLPDRPERAAIWKIWATRFDNIVWGREDLPDDKGWTGAEIKQCCEIAWRLGCSLKEAAKSVVPVSQSAPERLEKLRSQADGRFLSASYEGVFLKDRKEAAKPEHAKKKRAINLE